MTYVATEDRSWIAVVDAGAVGSVRRAATGLAETVQLPAGKIADLAIVASELAGNLYRHATDGVALVRITRRGGVAGVEIVALDRGPGMADIMTSAQDGHSTSGTLGIGLGAVTRQANEFEAYSRLGPGTVIVATIWPDVTPDAVLAGHLVAGISRPMAGEQVTGDGYSVRESGDLLQVMLCDGLGHGPLAATAAQAAISAFHEAPPGGPGAMVEHIHRALNHTRGAVVTVANLDPQRGVVRFSGLGNVSGCVVDGSKRRMMSAQPGFAGHQRPKVRELEIAYPAGSVLVVAFRRSHRPLDVGRLSRLGSAFARAHRGDAAARRRGAS